MVLEEREHAKRAAPSIYGEVIGYGLSGDAYHITAPAEDGDGAERCMGAAMKRAGMRPPISTTSTPMAPRRRSATRSSLRRSSACSAMPPARSMSSTKSATGHLLGAAGAVEAIFSLARHPRQFAPATLNLDNPSVETAIDLVPHTAKKRDDRTVLSNSFGFGGTNASLILRRYAGVMSLLTTSPFAIISTSSARNSLPAWGPCWPCL